METEAAAERPMEKYDYTFRPDTTVMDADHYDHLSFYGIPLVGGNTSGGLTLLALGGAAAGLASVAIGAAQTFVSPFDAFYFDELFPFIQYKMDFTHGRHDMLVLKVFDQLSELLGDVIANPNAGIMRIKNFDFVGSYTEVQQIALTATQDDRLKGTLGMIFMKANPIWAVLAAHDNQATRSYGDRSYGDSAFNYLELRVTVTVHLTIGSVVFHVVANFVKQTLSQTFLYG